MTTIAYKDGVIAYDSRCAAGSTILDDDFDKHVESDGVHYFFSGRACDTDALILAYKGELGKSDDDFSAWAFVFDSGKLYLSGFDSDGLFKSTPNNLDRVYAIGSGEDHALTAMDMGASAVEAVEMAAKRDTNTGGKVRSFRVRQPE